MQIKFVCVIFIALMILGFYAISIYMAYNRGYEAHRMETESEATQIIIDSRQDVIVASKEVENAEKQIKDTLDCNAILDFDLFECLSK